MALISCPECKKKIKYTLASCPFCGCLLTSERMAKEKPKIGLTGLQKVIAIFFCITVIFIIFSIFLFSFLESSKKPRRSIRSSSSHNVVENSSWDDSVDQVKSWLKSNIKDPGSLEFIEWSPVHKTKEGDFMVRAKYRAKNSFGGYVIENKVFFLDSKGSVKNVMDY